MEIATEDQDGLEKQVAASMVPSVMVNDAELPGYTAPEVDPTYLLP